MLKGTSSIIARVTLRAKGARLSASAGKRKRGCDGFRRERLLLWRAPTISQGSPLDDILQLEVHDVDVQVLTGIYSEETHLPQPLRISITADLTPAGHYTPATPLAASKNYLDLKRAATMLPQGVHFTLVEAVAEHICETLFLADRRVRRVEVRIAKLAIAEAGESIGIRLVRHRR
jgi:7,8-dihydroneopterin aldolase/epimerase/oxygenase